MQSKKKGFTLIELLAVIVILAIIALIAVPVIMNVIGNARKSAFEDSAYGIVKAGEMYYTNELLENGGMTSDKEFTIADGAFVGENKLEVSGSLPSSGKVTVTKDGNVAIALSNGEYCVIKATTESKIESKPLEDLNGVCDYKKVANSVFTKATDGTSIPACIANNTECDLTDAGDDGIKVGVRVNNSKTKDFYVISEDASKGTITLIMNENFEENVAWVSKGDYISAGGTEADYGSNGNANKGPLTALNYLESQTSSWTNIPLETYELKDENTTPLYPTMNITARARMITYREASNLGCDGYNRSCPTWLYENTGSGDSGYWTSWASSYGAWYVYSSGNFYSANANNDQYYGVRPVITISKIII